MVPILHCIPSLGGGGAERQLAYLSGELARLGWETHVAFLRGGPNLSRLETGGAVPHRLSSRGNHDPRIFFELRRLVAAVRPALVQTWITQMDVLGGLAARLAGVPWVLSERSAEGLYPPTLKNRLRVWLAARAQMVVSNSAGGDRYWRPRLPPRVSRRVVPNGLPLDEIDRAAPAGSPGLAPGDDLLLYVGRLAPEKCLDTLLRALVALRPTRPALRAVLLGEGPERARLVALAREHGLEARVALPGYVDDVWAFLKGARVFVSLGRYEGRPNTVLEAMACGTPLVLSDIPAHREFLDEQTASLVDASDPAAVAGAIAGVLDAPKAAAARARCARARAEAWSLPAVARQYDAAYREVLSWGPERPPREEG